MGILQELGIDAIGTVSIPQKDWQAVAHRMIKNRRRQVTKAFARVTTERQKEALEAELKRMADLESYVRACESNTEKFAEVQP